MNMRSGLSQAQEQALMRPAPETMAPPAVALAVKEIPYDYVAKFTLQGRRGNRVQDVINISVEGAFVAVAIGYSFIPAKLPDRTSELDILKSSLCQPPDTRRGQEQQALLKLACDVFMDPRLLVQCLLVWLCGIDFKYSIVDSAIGRELQNQPIHNIAGLGEATGDRPFRPLAKPMLFLPRSTIRIEIEEISEGPLYGYDDPVTKQRIGAELFIVLHGYKMLGYGTALP
jgi:hypothetical protein